MGSVKSRFVIKFIAPVIGENAAKAGYSPVFRTRALISETVVHDKTTWSRSFTPWKLNILMGSAAVALIVPSSPLSRPAIISPFSNSPKEVIPPVVVSLLTVITSRACLSPDALPELFLINHPKHKFLCF